MDLRRREAGKMAASYDNYIDQRVEGAKISSIAGIQRKLSRERDRCNQNAHRPDASSLSRSTTMELSRIPRSGRSRSGTRRHVLVGYGIENRRLALYG